MDKQEFLNISGSYKSRDLVTFICACCGDTSSRIKKNILSSLKDVDFVCCSSRCSDRLKHPTVITGCKNCGKEIERLASKVGSNNFCGTSCAASFNNRNRQRSEDSRKKTADSLRKFYSSIGFHKDTDIREYGGDYITDCVVCEKVFTSSSPKAKYCSKSCSNKRSSDSRSHAGNKRQYCQVYFHDCLFCGCKIIHAVAKSRNRRKTCSSECRAKHMSRIQSERLSNTENRLNLGRHKKSYLEVSFEEWLKQNGVVFETEVHYRNTELNKSYYVDFLFKDRSLVIELDGTQHRKTVEKDRIRDEYLRRVHNLTVIRITHNEYRQKSRLVEICEFLGIHPIA